MQNGVQSGTLDSRSLMHLAVRQAFTYIFEQAAWSLVYNTQDKTQHMLSTQMDISLMQAHLRLDVNQMMDKQVRDAFSRVRPTLLPP
jgi:hypothetical protein